METSSKPSPINLLHFLPYLVSVSLRIQTNINGIESVLSNDIMMELWDGLTHDLAGKDVTILRVCGTW